MRITVKLFATFRKGRFDAEVREVPPGTTVSRIVDDVQLPERELGIILVNGRHADRSRELSDGDTLALFPLVGGG
ncbi:MAG: MoaD/ThiS family protein [Deltaproteobacteria bacterium]|nr:MoaD/ThiS family protein [Candidatus Deferrimicrobiaceae bacterium]